MTALAARIDSVLADAVESGKLAGVAATVADRGGPVYRGAFGKRDVADGTPMTPDTIFWIASMTKAITSVAALQMVERGLVTLDEPLGRLEPDLGSLQILEGFNPDGSARLRPATRPVTLRLLLTHTSGMVYDTWNANLNRYMKTTGIPPLGERKNATLRVPLGFEPGERWEYGIGIDWAGKLVERLSGQALDEYIRQNICAPLGMMDTGFDPRAGDSERTASTYQRQPDGTLRLIRIGQAKAPEFYMGGGGLFSTADDYLLFLRALLNGGTLNGVRILNEDTVAEANRNQIGDLKVNVLLSDVPERSNNADLLPGIVNKWGLAYMLNTQPVPGGRSAGSLAWAGIRNTYYWLDPAAGLAAVFMTQVMPFADPTCLQVLGAMERAIYRSDGA
ncbi:MAG: serine hydrolase domain-containing protein [Chloroflexota bacterium]